jgi:DNA-binding SARP family transcriptional activator
VDDLAEDFYQRLIFCHGRLRQTAEAVRVYDRCRRTLAAVLGIPPSAETEAIRKSIR